MIGVTGSMKISLCEDRGLNDTQSLKCDDKRHQKLLSFEDQDLATKPYDLRFEFLTGKV